MVESCPLRAGSACGHRVRLGLGLAHPGWTGGLDDDPPRSWAYPSWQGVMTGASAAAGARAGLFRTTLWPDSREKMKGYDYNHYL